MKSERNIALAILATLLGCILAMCAMSCASAEPTTCGDLCIYYDHDMSFLKNMRRFPIDVDSTDKGELMFYIQGQPYAADWVVNYVPARAALDINPFEINRIEIIEPMHTRNIPGDWGEGGVIRVWTYDIDCDRGVTGSTG